MAGVELISLEWACNRIHCKPVRELFNSFFGPANPESHKNRVLLGNKLDDEVIIACYLNFAVYQVYLKAKHSGHFGISAHNILEFASEAAITSDKHKDLWISALKKRKSVPGP